MESYDEYFKIAKMHTDLHARPKNVMMEEKVDMIVEK